MRRVKITPSLTLALALLVGCQAAPVNKPAAGSDITTVHNNTGGATTGAVGDTTKIGSNNLNPTGQPPLLPANPVKDGAYHEGEVTVPEALATGAQSFHVSAKDGGTYISPDGTLKVVIPPNALSEDADIRIKPTDTSSKPIRNNLIPGISYYMDMGTAHILGDQTIYISSKVDSRAIDELKARDPNFTESAYSLSKGPNGDELLTMAMPGPKSQPLAENQPKSATPYVLTVETADNTLLPIPIFHQDGHVYSNTGMQLLCADGCDHTAGFYTGEDIDIAKIQDWVTDEEEAGYRLIDNVKALDKNGQPITMALSSFNSTIHQQNCDFADAGCPDSGAKAKVALLYNHIISWRFPGDMVYPATTVDGKPNPLAGQPFPGAGKMRRPPDNIKEIADRIELMGTCEPPACQSRVYGQLRWRSDDPSVNGQIAHNDNDGVTSADLAADKIFMGFKGLAGAAGGETTVVGRERGVDRQGESFETMACSQLYNIFGYMYDRRFPSGMVTGGVKIGTVDGNVNYQNNPIQCTIPKFSPLIVLNITAPTFALKNGTPYTVKYTIDDGPEQVAREVLPPQHDGDLPGSQPTVVRIAGGDVHTNSELDFYAAVPDDGNHTFKITAIDMSTMDAIGVPVGDRSIDTAKRIYSAADIHSGVFRNGIFQFDVKLQNNLAKYSVPGFSL